MRAKLIDIGQINKYTNMMRSRNGDGAGFSTGSFLFLLILDEALKYIMTGKLTYSFFIYMAICIVGAAIGISLRKRNEHTRSVGFFIALNYTAAFAFVCHCAFLYPIERVVIVYIVVVLILCVAFIVHPIIVVCSQFVQAAVFLLCAYLADKSRIDAIVIVYLVIILLIATTLNILNWIVHMQSFAFKMEMSYMNGSGEDDGKSDDVWVRNPRYSILTGRPIEDRKSLAITIDMTNNHIENIKEKNAFGLKLGMSFEQVRDILMEYADDERSKRSLRLMMDLPKIEYNFSHGKNDFSCIAGFLFENGERMWFILEGKLAAHPISGSVICILRFVDVTTQRITTSLLGKINELNYDSMITVDTTGKSKPLRFSLGENGELTSRFLENYPVEIGNYIDDFIEDKDKSEVRRLMELSHVISELEKSTSYEFLIDENCFGKEIRKKRYQYYYLDPQKTIIAIFKQDVTDLIEKEQREQEILSKALEEANRANNIKNEFLSRMSHEMRTPMNAIMGLTTLMEDEINNPEIISSYIGKMKYSSEFLLNLINNVLDMTKLETDKIELNSEEFTFGDFMQGIDSMVRSASEKKNVRFMVESSIDPSLAIETDRGRLTQILMNLCDNAVNFTENAGTVVLLAEQIGRHENFGKFRFVVTDNGIGMSEEFQKRMFDSFEQEEEFNAAGLKGTGLGLSIVKKLVDTFGGKIDVESKKDRGTKVTVEVKLKLSSEFSVKTKKLTYDDLNGRHVLVVEDNDINREIAVAILEKAGMVTIEAVDGEEAVEKFAESALGYFDAILMDIRMPKKNGLQASKEIRSLPRPDANAVPIIALTANAFADDKAMSLNSGMNAHLSKPIEPKTVYDTLLKCMK